jgi:hypothetical protein
MNYHKIENRSNDGDVSVDALICLVFPDFYSEVRFRSFDSGSLVQFLTFRVKTD